MPKNYDDSFVFGDEKPEDSFDDSFVFGDSETPAIQAEEAQQTDDLSQSLMKVVENTPARFKRRSGGLMAMAGDETTTVVGALDPVISKVQKGEDVGFFDRLSAAWNMSMALPALIMNRTADKDSMAAKGKRWLSEKGREIASAAQEEIESNQANPSDPVIQFATDVARGTIDMGPMLAAGFLTRGQSAFNPAASSIFAGQVAGDTYIDRIDKGVSASGAMDAVKFNLMAEALPEQIPAIALLKRGTPFLKRFFNASFGEGVQETITAVLQDTYDKQTLENMSLKEALLSLDWKNVFYQGGVGMGVGGALSVPASMVDAATRKDPGTDQNNQPPELFRATHNVKGGVPAQQATKAGKPIQDTYVDAKGNVYRDPSAVEVQKPSQPIDQPFDSAFDAGPLDANAQAEAIRAEVFGGETTPEATQGVIDELYPKEQAMSLREEAINKGITDPSAINDYIISRTSSVGINKPEVSQSEINQRDINKAKTGIISGAMDVPRETEVQPVSSIEQPSYPGGIDYQATGVSPTTTPGAAPEAVQEADRRVQQDKAVSDVEEELRGVKLPEGLDDPRIKRVGHRRALTEFADKIPGDRKKKATEIDPSVDDLLVAAAKAGGINRDEAIAQGIDPETFKDKNKIFGRPLFPKTGGLSMDGLAEKLNQDGYVTGENGTYDANKMLDLVMDNLSGNSVFSQNVNVETRKALSEISENSEGLSPKQVQTAISKALSGGKLGKKQARVVRNVLDNYTDERTDPANISAARQERKEKLLKLLPVEMYQQEMSREDAKSYQDAPSDDAALFYEWADRALDSGANENLIEKIIEDTGMGKMPESEAVKALIQLTQEKESGPKPERRRMGAEKTEGKAEAEKPLELKQQTEADIQAQEQAAEDARKAEAEAESKARADKGIKGFKLTGSKREADVAAAAGQEDLLAQTKTTDKVDNKSAEVDKDAINSAANEAATSPKNDTPEPTDAQKQAGNYKVGKITINGLDVSIENPKGSMRAGTDGDGETWSQKMATNYGYFRGKGEGADGDAVDVFLTDEAGNPDLPVFVIDQINPRDGSYDEHKVVMGVASEAEARSEYLSNYEAGWQGIGGIKQFTLDEFKAWLDGDTTKPVTDKVPASTKLVDEDRFQSFLDKTARRILMEDQGQDILYDLEEADASPQTVSNQFWKEIYPDLNPRMQEKFNKYLKSLSGWEPGSVVAFNPDTGEKTTANTWPDLARYYGEGFPASVEGLEGTERGYVALMAWATEKKEATPSKKAAPKAPKLPEAMKAGAPDTSKITKVSDIIKVTKSDEKQATEILNRAEVTGTDRLDIMSKFRAGEYSLEDLGAAYPARERQIKNMSADEIKAEIIVIGDRAMAARKESEDANPEMSSDLAQGDMDFMSDKEKTRLHKLKLSLPSTYNEIKSAKERTKVRRGLKDKGKPTEPTPVKEDSALYSGYERKFTSISIREPSGAERAQGTIDLFTPTEVPSKTVETQSKDNFDIRYKQVEVSQLNVGIDKIEFAADAAHIVAPIRKHAQETMLAVVIGEDGKVLNVIRHTKGQKDSASVSVVELAAAVGATPGAVKVVFAHNHPSGNVKASSPDKNITKKMKAGLEGSGVNILGHIIVGKGTEFNLLDQDGENAGRGKIPPFVRGKRVPVTERVIRKRTGSEKDSINDPNQALDAIRGLDTKNGLLLLNNKYQPIGVISMSPKEIAGLRESGQVPRILKAIDSTNAAAGIIISESESSAKNLGNYLARLDGFGTLDAVVAGKDKIETLSSKTIIGDAAKLFFSKGQPTKGISKQVARKSLVSRFGKKAIESLEESKTLNLVTENELPNRLNDGKGGIKGVYDPVTDSVFIVVDNVTAEEMPGLTFHELGEHYGMEKMLGKELYKQALKQAKGMINLGHKGMAAAKLRVPKDTAPENVDAETLAYFLQDNANAKTSLFKRVIAALRAFLFKRGFNVSLTTEDLQALAVASIRASVRESRAVRGNPDYIYGVAQYAKAYHGTPHTFDKFKMENIGAGEGVQAYGYGLYFAENSDVAGEYQSVLSRNQSLAQHGGTSYELSQDMGDGYELWERSTAKAPNQAGFDQFTSPLIEGVQSKKDALKIAKERGMKNPTIQDVEGKELIVEGGNLYTVDIPDKYADNFLVWDKPLSEQPESVREALIGIADEYPEYFGGVSNALKNKTSIGKYKGADFYDALMDAQFGGVATKGETYDLSLLQNNKNSMKLASDKLNKLGIKGIRYLDQGSRGVGEGTSNYVVFDESIVKIVSINGKPVSKIKQKEAIKDLRADADKSQPMFSRVNKEQTKTKKFKLWFGDSKVVDKNGDPLVVYHGANVDWDAYDSKFGGTGAWAEDGLSSVNAKGENSVLVMTSSKSHAERFGEYTKELYVALKNPLIIDGYAELNEWAIDNETSSSAQEMIDNYGGFYDASNIDGRILDATLEAKNKGYDGFIIKYGNLKDIDGMQIGDIFGVFKPAQIKSSVGNTGAFDSADPRIMYSRGEEPTGARLGMPEETRTGRWQRWLQDSFNRIKTLQETIKERGGKVTLESDVHLAEERHTGKITDRLKKLDRRQMKRLVKMMADSDLTLDELDEYLMNRHAKERNDYIASIRDDMQDGGSGIKNKDAKDYLESLSPEKTTALEAASEVVYEVNKQTLRDLVEGGHLKQETVDEWQKRWKYYVPLKGKEGEQDFSGKGAGFSVKGSGILDTLGRGEGNIAESPTAHAFAQAESTIVRTEKTKVGQALVQLMRDNPDPDFWTISKRTFSKFEDLYGEPFEGYEDAPTGLRENIDYHAVKATSKAERKLAKSEGRKPRSKVVYMLDPKYRFRDDVFAVMVEGEELLINIKDDLVAEQLKKMNSNKLNAVVAGAGQVNRYLAMINTALNPEFVITNFERDFGQAMINLSGEQSAVMAAKVAKLIPSAMRGIWQSTFDTKGQSEMRDLFDELQAEGGTIGFFGLEDIQTKVKNIQNRLENSQTVLGKGKRGITMVRDVILDANLAVENASRLAAYKVAKEHFIANGDGSLKAEKEAKMRAASLAKNLTVNFNRKGELAPVLNSMYLFYNASIQGSARIFTALKNKRVQKIVGGVMVTSFALALFNREVGGDDDDGKPYYDKISDYIKQTNMIFMHPDGSGNYTKIKMPYGYNVFWYTGVALNDLIYRTDRSVTEVGLALASTAMNAFNPIQGADLLDTITPTVLKPFEQSARNINFMGGDIVPESPFDKYDRPDSQKKFKSTNPQLVSLMESINSLTGGDQTHSGIIDVSPETVKHYVGWLSGGAGLTATRTVGLAADLATGEPIEARNVPFVRTLGGKPGSRYDTERFYSAIKEIEAVKAQTKIYRGTEKYRDYRAENRDILRLSSQMLRYKGRIKKLRERRDRAYREGDHNLARDYSEQIKQQMMKFSSKYDEAASK